MAIQTISPTQVEFYADHTDEALEAVVTRYTDQSLAIALGSGVDHPLSKEAMAIANAAWGEQERRKLGLAS